MRRIYSHHLPEAMRLPWLFVCSSSSSLVFPRFRDRRFLVEGYTLHHTLFVRLGAKGRRPARLDVPGPRLLSSAERSGSSRSCSRSPSRSPPSRPRCLPPPGEGIVVKLAHPVQLPSAPSLSSKRMEIRLSLTASAHRPPRVKES